MQSANTRRPSVPTSTQPVNGSSSLPRPTMNSNMENYNINGQLGAAASAQTNPDGINNYKTRAPSHGMSTAVMPTGLFSSDGATTRSASGPPLSRLNSNQMAAAAATRAHNASFKDLVAKFNHSMEDGAVRARYARSPSATVLPSGYRPHSGPRSPRSPRMRPSANRQASRVSIQSDQSDRSEGDKFDLTSDKTYPVHATTSGITIPVPESPATSDQEESPSQTAITPLLGDLSWGMSQWGRPGFGGYGAPPHSDRRVADNHAPTFLAPISQPRRGPIPRLATSSGLETTKTFMSLEAPPMQRSVSDISGAQATRETFLEHRPGGVPRDGRPNHLDGSSPTSPRSKIPIRSSSHNPLDGSPRSAKRSRHDASDAFAQAQVSRQQRRSITPPGRFYSTRYDSSPTRPRASGHRLKAIITAPEPKVSPPLRSSRPRQHIGSPRSNSPITTRASELPIEPDLVDTARDDSVNIVKQNHPTSEKGNLLTQLSNAVYQRPAPKLTLELRGIHEGIGGGPLTGATEFEEDISPIIEMPGSFPVMDDDAPASFDQTSLQTLPAAISSSEDGRASGGKETSAGHPEYDSTDQTETTQNVLDRIMVLRERSSALLSGVLGSPTSSKSASPQKDQAGPIDISPSENPTNDRHSSNWQGGSRRGSSAASSPAPSSMRGGSGALSPTKRSPTKGGLGRTASRITLDSDSYSVINRVLDQYHETGTVSPEMVNTFQKHIMETDPELSARGDIDSLSIAKAALEDFVRDHSHSNLTGDRSQSSLLPSSSQHDLFARDGPREIFLPPQRTGSYPRIPALPRKASDIMPASRRPHGQDSEGSPSFEALNRQNGNSTSNLRLRHQSIADQLVPHVVPTDQSLKDREDDVGPTPPPKDFKYPTPPKADRGHVPEGLKSMERQPRQAPTVLVSKRPLLPEIPSTGGGLGLLITPRPSYEAPAAQRPSNFMQAPPSSYNAVRMASPSPSLRARGNSVTASSPTSDSARASFGHQSSDPQHSQQDTPASSTQKSASFDSDEVRKITTSTSVPEPIPQPAAPQTSEQRRLTKRRHTIKELVDTEFSFNQDMKVIEDIYKGTASAVEALTADDRRVLFGNSAQIVEFSESFLDTLKQASLGVYVMPRNNKWRVKRGSLSTSTGEQEEQLKPVQTDSTDDERDRKTFIGEAFGQHMVRMEKVYGDYLRNHDLANQRLGKLQTVPQVNLWLNECHTYATDITSAWDLDSLLVKPVQRILKYPLLLKSLLEETPADHPDYAALEIAVKQMMDVSFRINESKKRAELLDQVVNKPNKRKDYDVSNALSKAFGRRTDKLKQQVGLSDAVEDPEYKAISEKFGGQFFQLQVVMRDMEMYMKNTEDFVKQYNRYIEATEDMIDVGHNRSPELEVKWKRFALAIRELTALAYADHESAVRKHCIQPMLTLLNMHEAPQRLMQKRKKRIVEYARYLTMKNRGEKLDKRTQEQGEQFVALNETLKDELPKLFMLTAKLVQACLRNYIDIQAQWHATWQRKIKAVLKEQQIPRDLSDVVEAFYADFEYTEARILSLGICNGSTLAQTATFVTSSAATLVASDDTSSMKRPSILTANSVMTVTGSDSQSPVLPQPDFVGKRRSNGSSSFANMPSFNSPRASEEHNRLSQSSTHLPVPGAPRPSSPQRRVRAGSANSLTAGRHTPVATPPTPHRVSSSQTIAYGPYSSTVRGTRGPDSRPPTANRNHSTVTLSRLSASSAKSTAPPTSAAALARTSSSTLYSAAPSSYQRSGPSSPNPSTTRFSGVFNSALPASDSPPPPPSSQTLSGNAAVAGPGRGRVVQGDGSRVVVGEQREYRVLFLAASLFEFNIDRSRKEAGYPYLTYVPGEVFDVIGEKGELWLARNQDDGSGLIGWIWEKHFAKLMPEAA